MDKNLIERVAQAVIKDFSISHPITDIKETVISLGGEVVVDNSLPFFVDGQVEKVGNAFKVKVIDQPSTRLIFTIAHELGHLFLHMGYRIDGEMWKNSENIVYQRKGNSQFEYDANEFAANFLMPEKEFKKICSEYSEDGKVDIGEVAKYFNVSLDAVTNRGRWLGFFRW